MSGDSGPNRSKEKYVSINDLNSINNNTIENEDLNYPSSQLNTTMTSSQRPNLQLDLTIKEPKEIKCLFCPYSHANVMEVEQHINRKHFDLTSPSLSEDEPSGFNCPCCAQVFDTYGNLEAHVYYDHADVISPTENHELTSASTPCHKCPVCNVFTSTSSEELTEHVELHFSDLVTSPSALPDSTSDTVIAKELTKTDQESLRMQQQKEFERLQAQYGMDNKGNFKEQSIKNMQKAVYAGELTVTDFFEKQIELKMAENVGLDDGSSCVKEIIQSIKSKSKSCENVSKTYMCCSMDFYSSTYGDKGWGCGYRNLQMLLSSLWYHVSYGEFLRIQLCSKFGMEKLCPNKRMPSISKLQQLIEMAWAKGFDEQGREQLGGKLHDTKKWIGATEVVTLLSALGFRCLLLDINRPNDKGLHPKMFEWILKYFQKPAEFKAPLYLQHHGHSQTVIGIEILKDGEPLLLIIDPSTRPNQMEKLLSNNTNNLGLIRKSIHNMKSDQYQIATVTGLITSDEELQASKTLRSIKIF